MHECFETPRLGPGRFRLAAAALLGAVLLAGCSSSSQPEPKAGTAVEKQQEPAGSPATAPAEDKRPVILSLGDSITAGFGLDPGKSYSDVIQAELDRRGYSYHVVNAGISGDTTSGGLSRIDLVLANKPKVVIVELGGNDGLRGLPLSVTRANLEQIIQKGKASGADIVLVGMTLPPNYGPDYIRSFEKIYEDLASQYKLPMVGFGHGGAAAMWKYLQKDGLHPTEEGQQRLAGLILKVVEPMLRK